MTLKVLFIREMNDRLQEYFRDALDGVDVDITFPEDPTDEELLELAPEMDVLIGWRPSYELLEAAEKAKVFINPGVGVKRHIEPFRKLNSERSTPLVLVNGHGNAYFTAEHAVALLLSLFNKIVPYHNNMVSGKWRENDPGSSVTLRDKTVGLLGYGAINKHVHQFLSGFDLSFLALKRVWDSDVDNLSQFTPDMLHDFLDQTDVLILALPHTSETEGLLGSEELKLLGEDGVLINVARGAIIEEEALFDALKEKTIAGAGIDVWYNYQPDEDEHGKKYPTDYRFHTLENVVLSPHRAASPFDNLDRWDEQIENIRILANGSMDLNNIVDLDREY